MSDKDNNFQKAQLAMYESITSKIEAIQLHYIENVSPLINKSPEQINQELESIKNRLVESFKTKAGII